MNSRDIKEFVNKESGYDIGDKSRKTHLMFLRMVYVSLVTKYASKVESYEVIAGEINRNHTLVSYYKRIMPFELETNDDFRLMLLELDNKIKPLVDKDIIKANIKLDDIETSEIKRQNIKLKKDRIVHMARIRQYEKIYHDMLIT